METPGERRPPADGPATPDMTRGLEAATPGPWEILRPFWLVRCQALWVDDETVRLGETWQTLGVGVGGDHVVCLVLAADPYREDIQADPVWADALFIARARTALPRLRAWAAAAVAALRAAAGERLSAETRAQVEAALRTAPVEEVSC